MKSHAFDSVNEVDDGYILQPILLHTTIYTEELMNRIYFYFIKYVLILIKNIKLKSIDEMTSYDKSGTNNSMFLKFLNILNNSLKKFIITNPNIEPNNPKKIYEEFYSNCNDEYNILYILIENKYILPVNYNNDDDNDNNLCKYYDESISSYIRDKLNSTKDSITDNNRFNIKLYTEFIEFIINLGKNFNNINDNISDSNVSIANGLFYMKSIFHNTSITDKLDSYLKAFDMEVSEEFFKKPGIILKIIDHPKDITNYKLFKESKQGGGFNDEYIYKLKSSDCISFSSGADQYNTTHQYGPFRRVFSPIVYNFLGFNNRIENPKNREIFNYLHDNYGLIPKALNGKYIKLFGYGFSGSGKTYTLIQGSPPNSKNKIEDPSLLALILSALKKEHVTKKLEIDIDIYYPHKDNSLTNDDTKNSIIEKYHFFNPYIDNDDSVDLYKNKNPYYEIKKKHNSPVMMINNILEEPDFDEDKLNIAIYKQYEILENIMKKYTYIIPTSNNPNSSRAFTIIKIKFDNDKKEIIQFIDLPGLEKKVDMIKDYIFSDDNVMDIKNNIVSRGDVDAPKNDSNYVKKDREQLLLSYTAFYRNNANFNENVKNLKRLYDNDSFEIFEKKDSSKHNQRSIKLIFTNSETNNELYTTVIANAVKEVYSLNNNNFTINKYNQGKKGIFLMNNENTTLINDILQDYGNKIIYYTNYQLGIIDNYVYTVEVKTSIINNFVEKFIAPEKKQYELEEQTKSGRKTVTLCDKSDIEELNFIFENIFNITLNDQSDDNESKYLKFFKNPTSTDKSESQEYIKYKSPIITAINIIFLEYTNHNYVDGKRTEKRDNNKCMIFFIMLVDYILNQGQEIVTSLEHLLFEFLTHTPDGIKNYNNNAKKNQKFIDSKKNDVRDKAELQSPTNSDSDLLEKFYENQLNNPYKSEFITHSEYSGMEETTYRTYLHAMHNILNINDKSRFINILTILRPPLGDNGETDPEKVKKRCSGAYDTLTFGETLTGVKELKCDNTAQGGGSNNNNIIKKIRIKTKKIYKYIKNKKSKRKYRRP